MINRLNESGGSGVLHNQLARDRLIWINANRCFFAGLIGPPSTRTMGTILLYISLRRPIRISIDGGAWETTDAAIVQAYVPHRVASDDKLVAILHVEPETVDIASLPCFLKADSGCVVDPALVHRVRTAYEQLTDGDGAVDPGTADFDTLFWGRLLAPRVIERRIAQVVGSIKHDPCGRLSAADCATSSGLSVSRFLHLFKEQTGIPFRSYRTWKRARSLLYHVTKSANLAYLALDVGYPDSTHLSHVVRQVYGMTPTALFKGCLTMRMYGHSVPAACAI